MSLKLDQLLVKIHHFYIALFRLNKSISRYVVFCNLKSYSELSTRFPMNMETELRVRECDRSALLARL
jgi:hypothetical protein